MIVQPNRQPNRLTANDVPPRVHQSYGLSRPYLLLSKIGLLTPSPESVLVLTADGRTLTGILLSCDQLTNVVLQNTIERVIRPHDDPENSEEITHGLYLIRGENVAVCGLLDEELDARIDWANVRGNVIGGVKHQ